MAPPFPQERDYSSRAKYVAAIIKQSGSKHVKDVVRFPSLRDVDFHLDNYQAEINFRDWQYKYAAAVQERGQVSTTPCECCRQNEARPFTSFVYIDTEQSGKCANCIVLRQNCSQGKRGQSKRGSFEVGLDPNTTKKRFKSDTIVNRVGYSLFNPRFREKSTLQGGTYRVLGSLVLPWPTGKYRPLAEKYEHELIKLHQRDMSKLPNRPITNLQQSFLEFKKREAEAWEAYELNNPFEDIDMDLKDPRLLVKPSGSLGSPLAHRLNQPSFTSRQLYDAETADPTNGCIAMVMGNVYTSDTLLLNQFSRRSYKSEATEGGEYPDDVQACHVRFTAEIADSMYAKVELIYGHKVKRFMEERQKFAVLPLWGEFEGVEVRLMFEQDYGNPGDGYLFRRAILALNHPQSLMWPMMSRHYSAQHDKMTKAAWLMAEGKGRLPLVPDYFAEKKWKRHGSPKYENADMQVPEEIISEDEQPVPKVFDNGKAGDRWTLDGFFAPKPHSNNELRNLIPPALQAVESESPLVEWEFPKDLPPAVLDWLRGQKHILFGNKTPSNVHEVHEELLSILGRANLLEESTATDFKFCLLMMLSHQKEVIGDRSAEMHSLWHSGFDGRILNLRCSKCEEIQDTPDIKPRWSVTIPGAYVCHKWKCCKCSSRAPMLPVDKSIQFVRNEKKSTTRAPNRDVQEIISNYLCQQKDTNLPKQVETWCHRCKENTRINDRNKHIDMAPRFTAGYRRYVPRKEPCTNCRTGERSFFVPVRPDIFYLAQERLIKHHNSYGHMTLEKQLKLLNDVPNSSLGTRRTLRIKGQGKKESQLGAEMSLRPKEQTKHTGMTIQDWELKNAGMLSDGQEDLKDLQDKEGDEYNDKGDESRDGQGENLSQFAAVISLGSRTSKKTAKLSKGRTRHTSRSTTGMTIREWELKNAAALSRGQDKYMSRPAAQIPLRSRKSKEAVKSSGGRTRHTSLSTTRMTIQEWEWRNAAIISKEKVNQTSPKSGKE